MKNPSELDIRAAKKFQALARVGAFFPVECTFKRVVKTECVELFEGKEAPYTDIKHVPWLKGAEEFRQHFGIPASYFAGALEYTQAATGWVYPYSQLHIRVLSNSRRTSGGIALYPPGLKNTKSGEIRVGWANGEFTLTVFHELIHLFKRYNLKTDSIDKYEPWVEQQALRLTMEV